MVSAAALLCAVARLVLAELLTEVQALLMAPLYRLRKDDATADVAVVSIAC